MASDSTLLYAPEIKFYAMRVEIDKFITSLRSEMLKSSADLNMQTSVKNLFAAGDGAGLSRDIVLIHKVKNFGKIFQFCI